jgi:O-antigen/teichoic acid export membrane protein
MSFKKKTFKNIFQIARFTYLGEGVNFLATIILSRLLLPEEYGFIAMILVFSNFANILSGVGIGSEIIRSSYKFTFQKAMMNLSFYIGLGLFFFLVLLSYPIALFYNNFDLIIPTIFVALKFIPKSINSAYNALLLKNGEYTFIGKVELYNTLIANALMIIMAFLGFSYWSLIFPYLISDIFKLSALIKKTKLKLKIYSFSYTRVAFNKSKSLIVSILGVRIISYWARNLDNLLVGKQFGEGPLGIYNRGYRFLNLTEKIINNLFGAVLYPNLQKLKEENGDVFKEYLFFVGVITLLVFPIGAVLILIPELFVTVLWGQNWIDVAQYLPYFGLVIFVNASKSNIEVLFKIFYKEKLLFTFGIFNSTLCVLAIIAGSFHSALMIAKLLAFSQIVIVIPVAAYLVFWKSMRFNFKEVNSFYFFRILLLALIFAFLWFGYNYLTWLPMLAYLFVILFEMKTHFNRLLILVNLKFNKKKG